MKTIALIAHDGKKAEMVAFVKDHIEQIRKFKLVATGTTGKYVEQAGLSVTKLESGPHGGDAQIAAMRREAIRRQPAHRALGVGPDVLQDVGHLEALPKRRRQCEQCVPPLGDFV